MTPATPEADPATDETRAQRLYKEDGWTWAMEQAEALRRRDMDLIDWENIIEEIEDIGKRQRRSWISNCARAIEHLLAIEYYVLAEIEEVNHWADEVQMFRTEMADVILDNPGLNGIYDEMFATAWMRGRHLAVLRLARYDRQRSGGRRAYKASMRTWESRLPLECTYTLQDVSAFDHRIQDYPQVDAWPPSVAQVIKELLGSD